VITLKYRNARGRVRISRIQPDQLRRRLSELRRRGLSATAVLGREEVGWVYCGPAGWQYSVDDSALEAGSGAVRA
jgi:hypothetical protein